MKYNKLTDIRHHFLVKESLPSRKWCLFFLGCIIFFVILMSFLDGEKERLVTENQVTDETFLEVKGKNVGRLSLSSPFETESVETTDKENYKKEEKKSSKKDVRLTGIMSKGETVEVIIERDKKSIFLKLNEEKEGIKLLRVKEEEGTAVIKDVLGERCLSLWK